MKIKRTLWLIVYKCYLLIVPEGVSLVTGAVRLKEVIYQLNSHTNEKLSVAQRRV